MELGHKMGAIPEPFLNGGEHADDNIRPRVLRGDKVLPRERLLHLIESGDYCRPGSHHFLIFL